jgi:hypothetical protein
MLWVKPKEEPQPLVLAHEEVTDSQDRRSVRRRGSLGPTHRKSALAIVALVSHVYGENWHVCVREECIRPAPN